jgi:hypothetical protein
VANAIGARNGLWHRCFLVAGIIGRDATVADVRDWLRANGEDVSREQVKAALRGLCGGESPLAEKSAQGRRGYGMPTLYRLTERGRAVFAED